MTTLIRFRGKNDNYMSFQVNYRTLIYVYSFQYGIVEIHTCPCMSIEEFAKIIEGCFAPCSNFEREILKALNADLDTKVKGIKVVFNDIHVCTATNEQHGARWIVSKYYEHLK